MTSTDQDTVVPPLDHLKLRWTLFFSAYVIAHMHAYDVIKYNIYSSYNIY